MCETSSFLVIDQPVILPIVNCMFSIYGHSPGWVYKGTVQLHSVKHVGIHLVSFWAPTVGIYA